MLHCPLCPERDSSRPFPQPTGPKPCRVMCIGEGPAVEEYKQQRVFVGRTGQELDGQYLPMAGLDREDVYVSNVSKCLRGTTRVRCADGKARPIRDIVRLLEAGESIEVVCTDNAHTILNGKVTRGYRELLGGRGLFRLGYTHLRVKGAGSSAAVLTADHPVQTLLYGYKPISELGPDDLIGTGTPGLDRRQVAALCGMLLGDTTLRDGYLVLTHCAAQLEYLQQKVRMLGGRIRDLKYNALTNSYRWTSPRLPLWRHTFAQWPKHDRVNRGIVRTLFNAFSLAVWYLDDGHFDGDKRAGICATRFSTDDFAFLLAAVRNLVPDAYSRGDGRIHFGVEAVRALSYLVAPYTPPAMRHKLAAEERQREFVPEMYAPSDQQFWDTPVVVATPKLRGERSVYCIDVARHHNFVTTGGVVHNCAGRTKTGALDNPSDEQARACAEHFLPSELREVQPEIVILMGAVVCRAVLGEVDLEMHHGLPWRGDPGLLANWQAGMGGAGTIICTYHPAAGLRDTSWMIALQEDFRRIRKILKSDWSDIVADPFPQPQYFEALTTNDIEDYFVGFGGMAYAGVDTESVAGFPWSIQVSVQPGTGMLIDADRSDLKSVLSYYLDYYVWTMHAAAADLSTAHVMGLSPKRRWVDTMEQAYWTQEFRIGLKPLAYRYLGMRMTDYNDVVGPPSKLELHRYMAEVADSMMRVVPPKRAGKSLTEDEATIRNVLTKVKRLSKDIEKDIITIKPWVRIKNWEASDRDLIETFAAKVIPYPSIANVDRADAIRYACRDADAALRFLPVIRRKAQELRRMVV